MERLKSADARAIVQQWRQSGRNDWIAVEGYSMWPFLRPGDAVRVSAEHPLPRPGDVIVFLRQTTLIVHRVQAIHPGQWQTQGDNQCDPDPPVAPEMVLGLVTAVRTNRPWLRGEISVADRRARIAATLSPWLAWPFRLVRCRLLAPCSDALRRCCPALHARLRRLRRRFRD
jgi:signal peptidase I